MQTRPSDGRAFASANQVFAREQRDFRVAFCGYPDVYLRQGKVRRLDFIGDGWRLAGVGDAGEHRGLVGIDLQFPELDVLKPRAGMLGQLGLMRADGVQQPTAAGVVDEVFHTVSQQRNAEPVAVVGSVVLRRRRLSWPFRGGFARIQVSNRGRGMTSALSHDDFRVERCR
jgi:hypothetical protein